MSICLVFYFLLAVATVLTGIPAASAPPSPSPEAKTPPPDLRLVQFRLSIWPEYDDPRVLVMWRGEVAAGTPLPTRLTLPIPKGADIIGAGMISEQDELLLHPHQVHPGEAQDELELNLPTSRFFAEFYYTPFDGGATKRFTYPIPTPYAIDRLEVDVQQPLQATAFSVSPQSAHQSTDDNGFTYHWLFYRNVKPGDPLEVAITYTRTATAPSVTRPQPQPAAGTPPRSATPTTVIALALLIGAAMALGGGAWVWRGYRRRAGSTVSSAAAAAGHLKFCFHCGRELERTYHFCPGCGTRLH